MRERFVEASECGGRREGWRGHVESSVVVVVLVVDSGCEYDVEESLGVCREEG